MVSYVKKFERVIISALIVMMGLTVFLATVELGWLIAQDIITPPRFLLEVNELLDIFGLFLLVLIGVELMHTLKIYLEQNAVHVEVVFMVAMIAVGRKVIILDVKELSSLTLVGIAAIIMALSLGYHYVRKHLEKENRGESK